MQGHGTVVTGSVTSGSVRVGDEVEWLPRGERVRVRSLQNHDQPVEEVHRGQRAAINLAGVHHEDVVRGQELATPGYLVPSRVLTVRLHCLADMKRPIKHRMPVRFHVGTAEIMGTVSLLDCDTIEPGDWGLAQLFLDEPATATWGQPFVLRESSATQTLGGGQVLQPVARKVRRRHLEMLERIERLWTGDARERALTVAWFGGFAGFTLADLVRGANLGPDEAAALVAELQASRASWSSWPSARRSDGCCCTATCSRSWRSACSTVLDRLHEQFPLMSTHDRQKVQSQLDYVGDDALVHAAVDRLIAGKQAGRRPAPHRPGRLQAEAQRQPAQAQGQARRRLPGGALPAAGAGQLRRAGRRQRGQPQGPVRRVRRRGLPGARRGRPLPARRRRGRDAPAGDGAAGGRARD